MILTTILTTIDLLIYKQFSTIIYYNLIIFRGVAQLGARDIWDVEAAGSNPVTPTRIAVLTAYESRKVGILCGFSSLGGLYVHLEIYI